MKYRIELEFDAADGISLGQIVRGLEYNDIPIRNAMFVTESDEDPSRPSIVGDCAVSYKIVKAEEVTERTAATEEPAEDNRPIVTLTDMPTKGLNVLSWFGITTIGQLTKIRRECIAKIPNMGPKSMRALDDMMTEQKMTWGTKYTKAWYHIDPRWPRDYRFHHFELTDSRDDWTRNPSDRFSVSRKESMMMYNHYIMPEP